MLTDNNTITHFNYCYCWQVFTAWHSMLKCRGKRLRLVEKIFFIWAMWAPTHRKLKLQQIQLGKHQITIHHELYNLAVCSYFMIFCLFIIFLKKDLVVYTKIWPSFSWSNSFWYIILFLLQRVLYQRISKKEHLRKLHGNALNYFIWEINHSINQSIGLLIESKLSYRTKNFVWLSLFIYIWSFFTKWHEMSKQLFRYFFSFFTIFSTSTSILHWRLM